MLARRFACVIASPLLASLSLGAVACGGDDREAPDVDVPNPLTNPTEGPAAGNPDGHCQVPSEAGLEDVSRPKTVVGTGPPESCTGAAFIDAVAKGGVITFDCGVAPHTIPLPAPAKVFNDASARSSGTTVAAPGTRPTPASPITTTRRST